MKTIEQYVVLFTFRFTMVLKGVTYQMKALEQNFHVVLIILLSKVVEWMKLQSINPFKWTLSSSTGKANG